MALSVDFLSILLFVTLAQGLFILSVLVLKYKLRPKQHLLLFLMILGLIWFQAEFLSVRLPHDIHVNLFYGTRYGAWLLLGPLFFFYVLSIVDRPFTFRTAIFHFLPFIVFTLIIPMIVPELLSFRQVNYGMLSSFDHFNDKVSFIQYTYSTVFIIQFVHFLIYLVISFSIIRNYERNLKGSYSSLNIGSIRWLKTVNILLLIVLALVSLFLILFFVTMAYNRDFDYLYVLPMGVLIYLVGYKLAGVQWPASTGSQDKPNGKYERSSLKSDKANEYRILLEEFVAAKKPYLNNELRLNDLAELTNIPPHHLSQVINEQLQTTFFDYINRHRVEEAKRLIVTDEDSSILEIAFKAGFNNKTSFTNAFKKFTTQTPVEFRRLNKKS